MPKIEPAVERVLTALVGGLRDLNISFCVVGALVHELLLDDPLSTRTKDAGVVVMVKDLAAFDAVKTGLGQKGFRPGKVPHRLEHDDGLVDILPYSKELVPAGILELEPERPLNMAGFEHVARAAIEIKLDSGLVVPVIPLPLYALLKLVAYSDRAFEKDVVAVEHVLRHYQEADDRRWGLEHKESLVDVDNATAYLLGLDGKTFLGDELKAALLPVFAQLADDEERDDDDDGDDWRASRGRLFLWYEKGLGL